MNFEPFLAQRIICGSSLSTFTANFSILLFRIVVRFYWGHVNSLSTTSESSAQSTFQFFKNLKQDYDVDHPDQTGKSISQSNLTGKLISEWDQKKKSISQARWSKGTFAYLGKKQEDQSFKPYTPEQIFLRKLGVLLSRGRVQRVSIHSFSFFSRDLRAEPVRRVLLVTVRSSV
jgi:hypothetical protein